MAKMERSLIVGKFSPLHQGHERLIRWAGEQSESVIIFSYSNPELEGCEPEKRQRWLKDLFPKAEIFIFTKDNSSYPLNSEAANVHRQFVAEMYIAKIKKPLDAVFVGEDYAEGFANFMSESLIKANIQNHKVKPMILDRNKDPSQVSGTLVRLDVHKNKNLLDPRVYSDFVQTVCFLGSESTGKSTLTPLCAEIFATGSVSEYGRTLWEQKNGALVFSDLLDIAQVHIQNENRERKRAHRYLFIDTSPLTTLFYSHAYFKKADPELEKLAQRKYDHVFLCVPDFPLVQDGTRADEAFRQQQHEWYLKELKQRNINYEELSGSLHERVEKVKIILK